MNKPIMDDIKELKSRYNLLLDRIKKGGEYLDDSLVPMNNKEKAVPHFIELTREASKIINILADQGVIFDGNITETGFNQL